MVKIKNILILSAFGAMHISGFSEQAEVTDSVPALEWHAPGKYKLLRSNASMLIPNDYKGLICSLESKFGCGPEWELAETSFAETIMLENEKDGRICFAFCDQGYIDLKNVEELDSKELMAQIGACIERRNEKLRSQGLEGMELIDWVQEPIMNREANTITWCVEIKDTTTGKSFFNAFAQTFGRYGYELIYGITDMADSKNFTKTWEQTIGSYHFEPGSRYEDFVEGDKVSELSITSWMVPNLENEEISDVNMVENVCEAIVGTTKEVVSKIGSFFKIS
ncbi:MAG: DUF2167 domain-containing protein [Chlamydiia bacterium]